jgi:hypothetical protein
MCQGNLLIKIRNKGMHIAWLFLCLYLKGILFKNTIKFIKIGMKIIKLSVIIYRRAKFKTNSYELYDLLL